MTKIGLFVVLLSCVGIAQADDPKADAKTFHVPYRLTKTSHVLIRAKLNGKGPYNFIIDTGAPTLFVSTAVARKVGIRAERNNNDTVDRFEIEGGVIFNKCRARIEDPFQLEGMNGLGLAGVEIHGIIGYTILAQYRIEFDFTKDKLNWQHLDFHPPPPRGVNGPATAGGMEALGSIMKIVGAFLGKKTDPPPALRGFLGLVLSESEGDVQVKAVLRASPAAAAGLQSGDRITGLEIHGGESSKVRSIAGMQKQLTSVLPGESVVITAMRGDTKQTFRLHSGKGL
jgi:hypothetical protein